MVDPDPKNSNEQSEVSGGDQNALEQAARSLLRDMLTGRYRAERSPSAAGLPVALVAVAGRVCSEFHDVRIVVEESLRRDVLRGPKIVCDRAVDFMMTTVPAGGVVRAENGSVRRVAGRSGGLLGPFIEPDGRLHEESLLGLTFRAPPSSVSGKEVEPAVLVEAVNEALNAEIRLSGLLAVAAPVGQAGRPQPFVVGEYVHPALVQGLLCIAQTWFAPGAAVRSVGELCEIGDAFEKRSQLELSASKAFRQVLGSKITVPLLAHYAAHVAPGLARLTDLSVPDQLEQLIRGLREVAHKAVAAASKKAGVHLEVDGLGRFFDELRRKFTGAQQQTLAMVVQDVVDAAARSGETFPMDELGAHVIVDTPQDGSILEIVTVELGWKHVTLAGFQMRRTPYLNLEDFTQGLVDDLSRLGLQHIEVFRRDLGQAVSDSHFGPQHSARSDLQSTMAEAEPVHRRHVLH